MTPNSMSDGAFTTVRIQGGTQNTLVPKSPFLQVASKQEEGVAEMIHDGGGGMNITQGMSSTTSRDIQQYSLMTTNGRKDKRKQTYLDRVDVSPFGGAVSSSPVHKKLRGRPPSSSKLHGNKLSRLSGESTNPVMLANRVLTDAFIKKQQQAQNQMQSYIAEPLSKCPELPDNPELWTSENVFRFLSVTECEAFAHILKEEEIDGKSFLLLTRDALMEFKNIRLGPALKIVGYSSYLRAKSRILNMKRQNKPKVELKNGPSPSQVKEQISVSQIENVSSVNGTQSLPYTVCSQSPSSNTSISKSVKMTPSFTEQTGSTVAFQNFPVQHNIDDVIPVHNETSSSSISEHHEAPSSSKFLVGDSIANKEEKREAGEL